MSIITDLNSGNGEHPVDTVGAVMDTVASSPDSKAAFDNEMQKAEMDYKQESAKLVLEEEKLNLEHEKLNNVDRGRASDAQIAMVSNPGATKLNKNIAPILALIATILCFLLFCILMFNPNAVDKSRQQILTYILGVLSAVLSQVFSYYFGSSSGSADKNRTITSMLESKNSEGK